MYVNISLLALTLVLNILATRKILRTSWWSKKRKRNHLILVWILPLVWAVIILVYDDGPPKKTGKRKEHGYLKGGYSSYYGSTNDH